MPLGFYIILICCILFSFISFINLFLGRILDLACTFFAGIVDYRCSLIYQSLANTISLGTDIRVSMDGTIQDVSNIIYYVYHCLSDVPSLRTQTYFRLSFIVALPGANV